MKQDRLDSVSAAGMPSGTDVNAPSASCVLIDPARARIAFGTAKLGDDALVFDLLDRAFDLGCTVFDTARIYRDGSDEERLGRWLASRKRHLQVCVIAKGGHPGPRGSRLDRTSIESDVVASLRAQGADTLDAFVLHRDDTARSVSDIIEHLEELRRKGYVRSYGASNWTAARIREANEYALVHGFEGFSLSSPQFSLGIWRNPPWPGCHSIAGTHGSAERGWYRDSDLALVGWSSLGGGLYTDAAYDALIRGQAPSCSPCYATQANFDVLRLAGELARTKGCSVEAIALAYVMSETRSTYALFSCASADRLRSNVRATSVVLEDDERALLRDCGS